MKEDEFFKTKIQFKLTVSVKLQMKRFYVQ